MKIIKLNIMAILASMYGIALVDNGIVQIVCWFLFVFLFLALVAGLEKRYGTN